MPRLLRRPRFLMCRHPEGGGPGLSADSDRHLAKVAFAKLYDRKTPITAAEILNDRVVLVYDEEGIRISRMLTDRSTEFAAPKAMNTSSMSRSRISITAVPRPRDRRPTASANASIAASWTRSVGSIAASASCRPISMPGWMSTIIGDRIKAAGASVRPQCRPLLTRSLCQCSPCTLLGDWPSPPSVGNCPSDRRRSSGVRRDRRRKHCRYCRARPGRSPSGTIRRRFLPIGALARYLNRPLQTTIERPPTPYSAAARIDRLAPFMWSRLTGWFVSNGLFRSSSLAISRSAGNTS